MPFNKNVEIEFKTVIPKEKYEALITHFDLTSNVFLQNNHYFDTESLDLSKQQIVLRIRQKGNHFYKVTLKSQSPEGAYEYHVLLNESQTQQMIQNGFNTSTFFKEIDYYVTHKASIDNYRASLPYEQGTIFIDRCEYCHTIDYEIEYEVNDYDLGIESFQRFIEAQKIELIKTKRKSDRAFSCTIK
jgi:uncharacterized protein YjbK